MNMLGARCWAASAISAIIGFLATRSVSFLGVTSLGELGLCALAVVSVIKVLTAHRIDRGILTVIGLVVLSVTGYVISDAWNGTSEFDSQRRIGGVLLLGAGILGWRLFETTPIPAVIGFLAGQAAGGLLTNEAALEQFDKRSSGLIICFFTVAVVAVIHQRTHGLLQRCTLAVYAASALYCLLNDDRANAGLMVLMCAADARSILTSRRFRFVAVAIMVVTATLTAAVFFSFYIESDSAFASRRAASNGIRVGGWLTAAEAIGRSPIIGYGSWASPSTLLDRYDQRIADWTGRRHLRPVEFIHIFDVHSALLQSWFEGGILGFCLFAYSLALIARSLGRGFASPDRTYTAVYYLWAVSLWHLLFSPFSGTHRIILALAVACALSERARAVTRTARIAGWSPCPGESQGQPAMHWLSLSRAQSR